MLWDPTFESWANFGVSLQPSVLLLAPDGAMLGRWAGMPSDDDLLAAAAGATETADVTAGSDGFCRYAQRYLEADVALAAIGDVDQKGRVRVFDDIRFAANAMAQTAPADRADEVRAFSDAVVALAAAAIEEEFDLDAASAAGYDELNAKVRAAAAAISPAVDERCGVAFTVVAERASR
jgi:hypothetical protein